MMDPKDRPTLGPRFFELKAQMDAKRKAEAEQRDRQDQPPKDG